MKKNISNLSFEESLKKLEDIVDKLDSGEIDFDVTGLSLPPEGNILCNGQLNGEAIL